MDRQMISIPEPTLRRLPMYHHYLKNLRTKGLETVSCTYMGIELNLHPPQIRKDLAFTGVRGAPKIGYKIEALLRSIEEFLGWNHVDEAFIVGVGNLGKCLIKYEGFKQYGLKCVAAFDIDPKVIGKKIGDIQVLPLDKLIELSTRMKIKIGIITTPRTSAQSVADLMIRGEIKGIWNFASINIKVPNNIILQNEDIAPGFAVLSKKLQLIIQSGELGQEVQK